MILNDPRKIIQQLNIKKGGHIADLGAGAGFYTLELAKEVGPDGKIYAIDVMKDLLHTIKIEAAKLGCSNIEIIWGDIEKAGGTKLADRSMDSAVVSNVLFQIENKAGLAQEVRRILKPGGDVLVLDWKSSFGGIGPEQSGVFPAEKARELFSKNGFGEVREISAGDHHYGIIFKKK